jgi:multidrug efflux pump subunit AcrA (membrane-fusion protein)
MDMNTILQLLFIILLALWGCGEEKLETGPQKRKLTETVYASGILQPSEEYKVVSSVDGYLQQSLVNEGDSVKPGQLLFRLSNLSREAQVQTASQMVSRTIPLTGNNAPMVRELQDQLAKSAAQVYKDSLDYMRYKNLYEQNAVSASNYERFRLQYLSSAKQKDAVQQQIRQTRLSSAAELQVAQNGLAMANSYKANNELKSFSRGLVFAVYSKTGDHVTPNQPVALVGSGKMLARLSIDEEDYSKIERGQKVVLKIEAFPGKLFHATIQKIYPFLNGAEQSFKADAVFTDELPENVYGLNLEANIIIRESQEVLAVPKNAVFSNDSLWIKEGKERKKIKIVKGIEDNQWIEVKEGISPNTIILLP